MSVYRFRVTFEDREEVVREIEILSSSTFEELHTVILQSIKFDSIHPASFYVSDDYWRRGEEITLKPDTAENEKQKRKSLPAQKLMNKCKLLSMVEDPHQKFVYVYDPNAEWTLQVELMKISKEDNEISYPRVVREKETAPPQYKKEVTFRPAQTTPQFDDDDEMNDEEAYRFSSELEGKELPEIVPASKEKNKVAKKIVEKEDEDFEDDEFEEEEEEDKEEEYFLDEEDHLDNDNYFSDEGQSEEEY